MSGIIYPKHKVPVNGQLSGTYTVASGAPETFDFKSLIYVSTKEPPYAYLEATSDDVKLRVILSGPTSIEEPRLYFISDGGQLEAQVYLLEDDRYVFGPPSGQLLVRFVEPEDDYKRIEGEGFLKLKVYDSQDQPFDVTVELIRLDLRTRPI